jgi:hypothetical protein
MNALVALSQNLGFRDLFDDGGRDFDGMDGWC